MSNKSKAADILRKFLPDYEKEINLIDALEETAEAFLDNNTWGKMRESKLSEFVNWLKENNIVKSDVSSKNLFTNDFSPNS